MSIKFLFAVLAAFMVAVSPAIGQVSYTNATCTDTSTSQQTTYLNITVDGSPTILELTEPTVCPFGCNGKTGFCNQTQSSDSGLMSSLIPMLMALGLFGMGMMWKVVRPWDVIYRIMFIFFGLFFAMSSLAISNAFLSVTTDISSAVGLLGEANVVNSTVLLYFLVGALIFLTTIELVFMYFQKQKEKRESEE